MAQTAGPTVGPAGLAWGREFVNALSSTQSSHRSTGLQRRLSFPFALQSTVAVLAVSTGCAADGDGRQLCQGRCTGAYADNDAFPRDTGEVRTGMLLIDPRNPARVQYDDFGGAAVLEGDMVVGSDLIRPLGEMEPRSAIIAPAWHWPGGIIPYVLDESLLDEAWAYAGMKEWEAKTPILFVERTTEKDYVRFVSANGCYSSIGRRGGEQILSLGEGCDTAGAHEIGHLIGQFHEQSRVDRDQYIDVFFENIPDDLEYNFQTYIARGYLGAELGPYDVDSVMHYWSTAFSDTGAPTILTKDGKTINDSTVLSPLDVEAAWAVYGDGATPDTGQESTEECCAEHHDRGCSDEAVASCVCSTDPYCCTTAWDAQCVDEVETYGCGDCGGNTKGDGDCCEPQVGAGCGDSQVQACVCEADSYCCDTRWDGTCTTEVESFGCASCQPAPAMSDADCCSAHQGLGCEDVGVEACVCDDDPYCCTTAWDDTCVSNVEGLGCGSCSDGTGGGEPNGAGDCCSEHAGPGCDDPTIEACVCGYDSYCCETSWDGVCRDLVEDKGCGTCDGASPMCEFYCDEYGYAEDECYDGWWCSLGCVYWVDMC